MFYPGNSHAKRFELKSNAFDAARHLVYWPELVGMKPSEPRGNRLEEVRFSI